MKLFFKYVFTTENCEFSQFFVCGNLQIASMEKLTFFDLCVPCPMMLVGYSHCTRARQGTIFEAFFGRLHIFGT